MSINVVTLSGRVSRSPKRVRTPDGGGHAYVFPLAVREEGEIVFPIVVAGELPSFVAHWDECKLHEQPRYFARKQERYRRRQESKKKPRRDGGAFVYMDAD